MAILGLRGRAGGTTQVLGPLYASFKPETSFFLKNFSFYRCFEKCCMQIYEKMAVVEGTLATAVPPLGEAVRAASTCLHLPLYLHYLHAPPVLNLPFHCQELSVLLTQSSPQWLP